MNLKTEGHSLGYEAEQMVLLFFPQHENVTLSSVLSHKDGNIYIETTVFAEGKSASYTLTGDSAAADSKRELGNMVKKSAYFALRRISDMPTPWGILTGVRPAKLVRILHEEGHSTAEVRRILKETYLVEDEKAELVTAVAEAESMHPENRRDVCIYIGIPFCPTRCAYCSFISGTGAVATKAEYVRCLLEEIQKTALIVRDIGLTVRAVYIGGGTPTSLDAPLLSALLHSVREAFSLPRGTEFTTEAGRPDTLDPEKLRIMKDTGTTRISINPQTLHDETLRRIGRHHTAAQFREAFTMARAAGFDDINTDLIAGLPGEDLSMYLSSFDQILSVRPESITVHTLYLKRASYLKQSGVPLPQPPETADMLSETYQSACSAGYIPYYMYRQKATVGNLENVGYALPGRDCFYNTVTMTDCAHIFALGAGGVSRLILPDGTVKRVFNFKHDDAYVHDFAEILRRKEDFYKIGEI